MKKKILFLIPHLDLGGGARRIRVYCHYLDSKKYQPVVVVYSNQVIRNIESVIGEKTSYLITPDIKKIKQFIRDENIKLMYTFYDGQYQEKLFEILSFCKEQNIKTIGNNIFAYFDKRMDELFDLVIFQTKMMLEIKFKKNFVEQKMDYEKYKVLYNPVDVEYFSKFLLSTKDREEKRASLGFSSDDFIIGRFGRNDIVKWGDILFYSIIQLRNDPNIKFLIVGIPKSRKFILNFLSYFIPSFKSKVKIIEPMSDDKKLFELVQLTDIIGHSVNIGEGCSNAINEAMFFRKPVITNSTPHCDNGQVEQVEDVRTGIVVQNTNQFIQAIKTLKDNKSLREKMGVRAFEKAVNIYGARSVVAEFEYLIGSLLDKSEKPSEIHVSNSDIEKFRHQYSMAKYNQARGKTIFERIYNLIIRILNFLEYRFIQ